MDGAGEARAQALRLVSDALTRRAIPFQAVGGLAVRAWGGTRPLVDLDFYIPDARLADAAQDLQAWVRGPPERVRSPHWDLTILRLDVEGAAVELGGADSARYRDVSGTWHGAAVDFDAGVTRRVLGVDVPVMPRHALIRYKSALGRPVDLVDLHELTGSGGPVDTRLAVYGTLAPGEVNHGVVAGLAGTWEPGVVHGRLHPAGWGMTYGFRALRWDPDGPAVPVQVLTSPALPAAWARLDRFEGDAYRRIVVPVTHKGATVLAHIYVEREGS